MKTNVTLRLDADFLREARVVAAEEGRSISALLTDRLEAIVRDRKALYSEDLSDGRYGTVRVKNPLAISTSVAAQEPEE